MTNEASVRIRIGSIVEIEKSFVFSTKFNCKITSTVPDMIKILVFLKHSYMN